MNNGVNCTCILHVILTGEEKAGRMRTMNMKGSTNDNLNYMNDTSNYMVDTYGCV